VGKIVPMPKPATMSRRAATIASVPSASFAKRARVSAAIGSPSSGGHL
jgi:hypothetical protein